MKHILPLLCMACSLNAWGQNSIQIQTQTENYNVPDAYRITFEDGGRFQIIHSQSQGEIRIPLVDLKQIHFNDTTVSLVNQIKALENCEIMKTLLFEDAPSWSSTQFMPYLNASSITHVFIPNDEAFQAIPVFYARNIPCVLSITLDKSASFPFKSQLRGYNPETGRVGTLLGVSLSDYQLIDFLRHLVLNQFATGSGPYLRTLSGSVVKETDNGYQGIYELEGSENQYRKAIHVVQQIPDLENRKCVVTDAVVSDAMKGTYEVLQEMSPKFLELLKVPLYLLSEVGLIEKDIDSGEYIPDLSYFESRGPAPSWGSIPSFRWGSNKVNFTILAPMDEAIDEAFRDGSLLTWSEIGELADNLMLSPDWVTQGRNEVKEKAVALLAFINRHILFGNLLVDVPRNTELQIPTCVVTGNHASQTVSVRRDVEDGFIVASGKVVPGTIRHVVETRAYSNYPIRFTETMQSGLVMQIDKAIMNN